MVEAAATVALRFGALLANSLRNLGNWNWRKIHVLDPRSLSSDIIYYPGCFYVCAPFTEYPLFAGLCFDYSSICT